MISLKQAHFRHFLLKSLHNPGIWLGMVFLVCSSFLPLLDASCRTANNEPICCIGKQSHCYGFEVDYKNSLLFKEGRYNKTDLERLTKFRGASVPAGIKMRRCYCDDSCVFTHDCCPDYRTLCEKPVVDCEVSNWSEWDDCSRKCGRGIQRRTRRVVREPDNGGQQCPMLKDQRTCEGTDCGRRRVGRSNVMDSYRNYNRDMVNIISIRGDPQELLRLNDPRFDVRKRLYYGRLYLQNKTEVPEPDPYSMLYEITSSSRGCRQGRSNWPNRNENRPNRPSLNRFDTWNKKPWESEIRQGSFVCITCFANYMRRELGYRCTGTEYGGHVFRFRNLDKFDCYGTAKVLESYPRQASCKYPVSHYAFL